MKALTKKMGAGEKAKILNKIFSGFATYWRQHEFYIQMVAKFIVRCVPYK